ncbi:MAG: hypothetical protein JST70_11100 [Bacteroidetes bacterium]|nr:hypothetical protein [Bacteroidota bacterium]
MSVWKQRLLTNWHVMRVIRLGISIWMVATFFIQKDMFAGLFGAFFMYQAITDTGCCGVGGCYTPPSTRKAGNKVEEIEYEELK